MDRESYESQQVGRVSEISQHRPADAARFFEKAMNLVKVRRQFAVDADLLLTPPWATPKRPRRRPAPPRENRQGAGPGSEQRGGHCLRRRCVGDSGGRRTRQGVDEPRTAHRFGQHEDAFQFCVHAGRPTEGPEGALALLGPVFEENGVGLLNHAKADPDLDSLRGDARFQAMIARARSASGYRRAPRVQGPVGRPARGWAVALPADRPAPAAGGRHPPWPSPPASWRCLS